MHGAFLLLARLRHKPNAAFTTEILTGCGGSRYNQIMVYTHTIGECSEAKRTYAAGLVWKGRCIPCMRKRQGLCQKVFHSLPKNAP